MSRRRIFGTDGVRGKANQSLTVELALQLGTAAGGWIHTHPVAIAANEEERRPHVIIGRDTRISCDMLECALSAGLTSMGVDVVSVGVAPTPAVSHAVLTSGAAAGIVISASHNPFDDNGIKFFGPDGKKLPDSVEDQIQSILESPGTVDMPTGGGLGTLRANPTLIDHYIQHVIATVPQQEGGALPLAGLSLVLDCANGAAYDIAPRVFEALGAIVTTIHASPSGVNINLDCGSTRPAEMAALVASTGASAGLAFDGDADRVMIADENGGIVDGDRMMAIIAGELHRTGRLAGNLVVATIMSNVGLEQALQRIGVTLYRTDVGDRYVSEAMVAFGASIGGEQSGHILLPDITPTGDGIVTGLQVLHVAMQRGRKLSELASVVQNCPQRLINIRVIDKNAWASDSDVQDAIQHGYAKLGNERWLSVRPSGTESLVRVMAQGPDGSIVDLVVNEISSLIRGRYGVSPN